jgi:hypothetical protein
MSLLLTAAAALRGGWRTDFTSASFRGSDYDALIAALLTQPECRLILDRAVKSGELHGELIGNFPLETALHSIDALLGERPRGSLVVAREQLSTLLPIPASLDYAIFMTREANVATYTVAFPGTAFGDTLTQVLTDINPIRTYFDLRIDGAVYRHAFWQGFYASVAGGDFPAFFSILRQLSAAVRSVDECATGTCDKVEHRLVVTGYSLGATQALLCAMLYCDDSMQKTAETLGVSSTSFTSTTVMLFALPNAVSSGDTCAYVDRASKRLGMSLYSICDPLDAVEHLYSALPLARPAVPHVCTLESGGVYRINAASASHGTLYAIAMKLPWRSYTTLSVLWRMALLAASTHMITEYKRKLLIVIKLRGTCTQQNTTGYESHSTASSAVAYAECAISGSSRDAGVSAHSTEQIPHTQPIALAPTATAA